MSSTSNNPIDYTGKHYWPADHFSVPAETICFNIPPSPDADFRCIRAKGHRGEHEYDRCLIIRDYSWKDPQ